MLLVEHDNDDLAELERSRDRDAQCPPGIGKKYRWVMQQIRLVERKNQLYRYRSLRLKKLECSGNIEAIWINEKYRLELRFSGESPNEQVRILRISNHYAD